MNDTVETILAAVVIAFLALFGAVCMVLGFINRHPWPVAVVAVAVVGFYFVGSDQ